MFSLEDLELASNPGTGPFLEWLRRVHDQGGDGLIRRLALELLVEPQAPRTEFATPVELLAALEAWMRNPEREHEAMRWWMASDAWWWREVAKLALDWGGAARTGDDLARHVAMVLHFAQFGNDPLGALERVRARMRELPA